jgi:hypothetical protein
VTKTHVMVARHSPNTESHQMCLSLSELYSKCLY